MVKRHIADSASSDALSAFFSRPEPVPDTIYASSIR